MTAPAPVPGVIAADGEPACEAVFLAHGPKAVCNRPKWHAGGHLDSDTGIYWQAK